LVEAAIDVLASNGFAATSVAAIAGRVGVSKGVLTYHFPGKAELMCEVVRYVLDGAEKWMAPRVAGARSYHEALQLYISTNISFLDGHRRQVRALTEVLSNAQVTAGIPELLSQSQTAALTALESLFAGGQSVGEFGGVAPSTLAMSLRATIDATSERLRREPDFDLGQFEQDLLLLFSRAAAPEPGTLHHPQATDQPTRSADQSQE